VRSQLSGLIRSVAGLSAVGTCRAGCCGLCRAALHSPERSRDLLGGLAGQCPDTMRLCTVATCMYGGSPLVAATASEHWCWCVVCAGRRFCLRSELGGTDLTPMSLGLSHSLSRYKLKFSPEKVDTMIVQVGSPAKCLPCRGLQGPMLLWHYGSLINWYGFRLQRSMLL
jgi:hypothetical protein